MSFNALINQDAQLSAASGRDRYGKASQGSPVNIKCRFEQVNKTILNPQGETEPIDGIVFVLPTVTVSVGDKFTYQSLNYRVLVVAPIILGKGAVHHKELKVQRWLT